MASLAEKRRRTSRSRAGGSSDASSSSSSGVSTRDDTSVIGAMSTSTSTPRRAAPSRATSATARSSLCETDPAIPAGKPGAPRSSAKIGGAVSPLRARTSRKAALPPTQVRRRRGASVRANARSSARSSAASRSNPSSSFGMRTPTHRPCARSRSKRASWGTQASCHAQATRGNEAAMPNAHAVILAGGSGTRFWPASRRHLPKQLLPLAGATDEPLIAATVRRIGPLVPPERVWIATSASLVDATSAALPHVPRQQFLAEPVGRNTAPCIGWASATIARKDPDALVAVMPADHYIPDEKGFLEVVARALDAAQDGWLTTVGIVPTRPETGYGYIEVGEDLGRGARKALRFVEKPDRARAEAFVAGGRHLWNAGMFFFRTGVMRDAIAAHRSEERRV